jgi:hypothetical protein
MVNHEPSILCQVGRAIDFHFFVASMFSYSSVQAWSTGENSFQISRQMAEIQSFCQNIPFSDGQVPEFITPWNFKMKNSALRILKEHKLNLIYSHRRIFRQYKVTAVEAREISWLKNSLFHLDWRPFLKMAAKFF